MGVTDQPRPQKRAEQSYWPVDQARMTIVPSLALLLLALTWGSQCE